MYAGLMLRMTEEAPARLWRVRGMVAEVGQSQCIIGLLLRRPGLSANPVAAMPPLVFATRTGTASSYAPPVEVPAGSSGSLTGAGSLLAGGGGDEDEACGRNELIGGPCSAALPLAAPLATSPRESDEEKKLKAAFAAGSTPIQMELVTSRTARPGSEASAAAAPAGIFGTRSAARARELDPAALPLGVIDLDPIAWFIRLRSHSPPNRAEALGGQPPWQPDEEADHPPGDAPQPCKGAGEGRA